MAFYFPVHSCLDELDKEFLGNGDYERNKDLMKNVKP